MTLRSSLLARVAALVASAILGLTACSDAPLGVSEPDPATAEAPELEGLEPEVANPEVATPEVAGSEAADAQAPQSPDAPGVSTAEPGPPATLLVSPLGDAPGAEPFAHALIIHWRARVPGVDGPSSEEERRVWLDGGEIVERPVGASGSMSVEVPSGVVVDVALYFGHTRELRSVGPLAAGAVHTLFVKSAKGAVVFYGRVVEARDGTPIERTLVIGNPSIKAWTDIDGKFQTPLWSISALPEVIEVGGYTPFVLPGEDSGEEERPVLISLDRAATLVVTTTADDGKPAEGVFVAFELVPTDPGTPRGLTSRTWHGRTDAAGVARVEGLPARYRIRGRVLGAPPGATGRYIVEPSSGAPVDDPLPSELLFASNDLIELEPEEERELRWSLPAPRPLHGVVFDQHGRPVANVEVCVAGPLPGEDLEPTYFARAHRARSSVRTDDEGRFRFPDPWRGAWLVGVALSPWNARLPIGGRVSPVALPVTGAGEIELFVGVDLSIRGRVLDANGEPVGGAEVIATPQSFVGVRTGRTKRDGSFELKGLAAGPHDLTASKEDLRAAQLGVEPNEAGFEVSLELK